MHFLCITHLRVENGTLLKNCAFLTVEIAVETSLHDNFNFLKAPATSWRSSFKFGISTKSSLPDNFKIEKTHATRFFDSFKIKKAIETRLLDSFKIKKTHATRILPFFKIKKAPATRLRRFFKIIPPVKLNIYAISSLKWHQKQDLGLVLILKRSIFLIEIVVLILKRRVFLKFIDKTILKNARQQELCLILTLLLSWNWINIPSCSWTLSPWICQKMSKWVKKRKVAD